MFLRVHPRGFLPRTGNQVSTSGAGAAVHQMPLSAVSATNGVSMTDEFGGFCHAAERAINQIIDDGRDALLRSAGELEARWHPNGFVVFEFGSVGPGSLRLHIWPAGARRLRDSSEHVHTHVWDLYSRVLVGTYIERMYSVAVAAGGDTRSFKTARVDYVRDRNTLTRAADSFLVPAETVRADAGTSHTVQAGKAHQTLIPLGSFVATLLVVSSPRVDEALVYSEQALPASTHSRPIASADEARALLDELRVGLETEATR